MRYHVIRRSGIEQYLTLVGIKYKSIFEKRINQQNTIIIDESFEHDITLSFPEYVFELCKITNMFQRDKLNKVFELNNNFVYNKKPDKSIINDLIILTRKSDYKTMSIPDVDKNGAIRIMQSTYSETIISQISLKTVNIKDYEKLRTIIFNTTILPFVKKIIF